MLGVIEGQRGRGAEGHVTQERERIDGWLPEEGDDEAVS